jgi:glycosyltransferase involved in cell wall biosynthesis
MKKKKIAIIGTVGIPAKYGGFETLAEHLVRHMSDEYEVSVYCTKKKYPVRERKKTYLGARLIWLPFDANGISSILYDIWSIFHAVFYADVLLVLGVSGGLALPFVRRLTNRKIIVSIDGIEWKRNKWSRLAKCYLWWAEKTAVKYSHADISDNESIQDYTAFRYKTLSNIIEYGADHVQPVKINSEHIVQYPFLQFHYAFKVCRIEPENNIHIVLEAFGSGLGLPLVIVGNWDNSEYGRQLKEKYASNSHILLMDPVYEQTRLDLMRSNATVYLHGHSAGGTNPALVEAMSLGLPVMAFRVTYNLTTTENKAWYFSNVDELRTLVLGMQAAGLHQNAMAMKEIAGRRYTWKIIASKYSNLVNQVLVTEGKLKVMPLTGGLKLQNLIDLEMGHLGYHSFFYEKR